MGGEASPQGFAPFVKDNLSGTVAPGVNDDSSAGYAVRSRWFDTVAGEVYMCLDASVGAADWENITLSAGDLGSMALVNSPAPLLNGGSGGAYASVAALLTGHGFSDFDQTRRADIDAAARRLGLGLGTASQQAVAAFLQTANNLSDGVADTMLTNLGFSAFGKTVIDDADAGAFRSTIGCGTAAVEAATAFELRTSDANVWCVSKTGNDGSGTGKTLGTAFLTFGAAVTAAAAGDVILGWPGIYAEDLAVDKSLTIIAPGAIIGNAAGSITISGANTTLTLECFYVSAAAGLTCINNVASGQGGVTIKAFSIAALVNGATLFAQTGSGCITNVITNNIAIVGDNCFVTGSAATGGFRFSVGETILYGTGNVGFGMAAGANINVLGAKLNDFGSGSTLVSGSPGSAATFNANISDLTIETLSNINANVTAKIIAASASGTLTNSGAGTPTLMTAMAASTPTTTNTGSATDEYVTPDALAGSNFGTRVMIVKVFDDETATATGDGKKRVTIPAELNGMNLVSVGGHIYTTSSSGDPTMQIHNETNAQDVLTNRVVVEATEYDSITATTQPSIDTSQDHVATGDVYRFDCDTAGTGTQGFEIRMGFRLP